MLKAGCITGPSLLLRLIRPEDAEYVYELRTDPAYNTHLSSVMGTAEDQRRWIEAYKIREVAGEEYYYVIQRRDDESPCGLVRIYDIGNDHFTWGSWILGANKPPKAALESAILSFDAGFALPGMSRALIDVRRANTHAEAFYRRFGMTEMGSDAQDIFFTYSREAFLRDRGAHLAALTGKQP
jgi:RimJ/RimL family protein N-acetyltransferase